MAKADANVGHGIASEAVSAFPTTERKPSAVTSVFHSSRTPWPDEFNGTRGVLGGSVQLDWKRDLGLNWWE